MNTELYTIQDQIADLENAQRGIKETLRIKQQNGTLDDLTTSALRSLHKYNKGRMTLLALTETNFKNPGMSGCEVTPEMVTIVDNNRTAYMDKTRDELYNYYDQHKPTHVSELERLSLDLVLVEVAARNKSLDETTREQLHQQEIQLNVDIDFLLNQIEPDYYKSNSDTVQAF